MKDYLINKDDKILIYSIKYILFCIAIVMFNQWRAMLIFQLTIHSKDDYLIQHLLQFSSFIAFLYLRHALQHLSILVNWSLHRQTIYD